MLKERAQRFKRKAEVERSQGGRFLGKTNAREKDTKELRSVKRTWVVRKQSGDKKKERKTNRSRERVSDDGDR